MTPNQILSLGLLLGLLAACSNGPAPDAQIGNRTLNVARTALADGNPQMALTVTNAVLKSNPADSEALTDRGEAHYLLKNCPAATHDFRRALALAPRTAAAELGLGRCALPTDPRRAAKEFTRATIDAPDDAAGFNDLGIAQADQSDFDAAQTSFRSALARDPSMQAATINLGMSLALGGHPAQAEILLGPIARGKAATPRVRADYATALVLAGHAASADRILLTDMPSPEAQATVAQMVKLQTLSASPKAPG